MKTQKILLSTFLSMFLIKLISAQYGYGAGYYDSPFVYFQDEWMKFTILAIVLFGILFFGAKNTQTYQEHKGPFAILIGALSLIAATTLTKSQFISTYTGEDVMIGITWIVFAIIGLWILWKLWKNFKIKGLMTALIIILLILAFTDVYYYLPTSLLRSPFGTFIDFIQNLDAIIIWAAIFIVFIILIVKHFRKGKIVSPEDYRATRQARQQKQDN